MKMLVGAVALALYLETLAAAPGAEPDLAPAAAGVESDASTAPAHAEAPKIPPPPPLPEPTPQPAALPAPGPVAAPSASPAGAAASAAPAPETAPPPVPLPDALLASAPGDHATGAALALAATLEVVNAKTRQVVFALMDAPASVRLTLKPGKYLLRRVRPEGTVVGKVVLKEGREVEVPEVGVRLVAEAGASSEATNGGPVGALSTLRAHTMQAQLLFGLRHVFDQAGTGRLDVQLGLSWGLTDRLQLGLLDLAYRVGSGDSVEFIPYLRLLDVSGIIFGTSEVQDIGYVPGINQRFAPSAGATLRGWLRQRWAINLAGAATLGVAIATWQGTRAFVYGWEAHGSAGFTRIFLDRVVLNLGVRYGYFELRLPSRVAVARHELVFGSAQSVGPRTLPLVGVELADWLTLETHLTLRYRPDETDSNELRLLVGTALTW